MGIIYNSLTPTEGLVLSLDSANRRSYPGSGNTWFDLSGNGNNGTLTGGVSYNGFTMNFDGVDDRIITPITQTYSLFTLSCWFLNSQDLAKDNRTLISKNSYYANTENDWPVSLTVDSAGTSVGILITSGTSYYVTTPSTGSAISTSISGLGKWFHAAATYDRNNLRLYINGILTNSTANTIALPNNTGRAYTIGRSPFERDGGLNKTAFNSSIDDVRIYSRALNTAEIGALFNAKRRRYGL